MNIFLQVKQTQFCNHFRTHATKICTVQPPSLFFSVTLTNYTAAQTLHLQKHTSLSFAPHFFFFCIPSYISGVQHFLAKFVRTWLLFNPTIEVVNIPSSWMVTAGCFFVASIYPSWPWMSGCFECVQCNACVHRLDLGQHSHLKELEGLESEPTRCCCLLVA